MVGEIDMLSHENRPMKNSVYAKMAKVVAADVNKEIADNGTTCIETAKGACAT